MRERSAHEATLRYQITREVLICMFSVVYGPFVSVFQRADEDLWVHEQTTSQKKRKDQAGRNIKDYITVK